MTALVFHEPRRRPCIVYDCDRFFTVCLSDCLSIAWIVTKQKKVRPKYTLRQSTYPSFLRRRMVAGHRHFYVKPWVKLTQFERNRRFSIVSL